uniref:Uncharacterized protein n=1 Tax=Aegilops tauschii subsp. strangulata TaxID=200361 RepID=A0A453ILW7_AEGTS
MHRWFARWCRHTKRQGIRSHEILALHCQPQGQLPVGCLCILVCYRGTINVRCRCVALIIFLQPMAALIISVRLVFVMMTKDPHIK